jgi:hypothetical protein
VTHLSHTAYRDLDETEATGRGRVDPEREGRRQLQHEGKSVLSDDGGVVGEMNGILSEGVMLGPVVNVRLYLNNNIIQLIIIIIVMNSFFK